MSLYIKKKKKRSTMLSSRTISISYLLKRHSCQSESLPPAKTNITVIMAVAPSSAFTGTRNLLVSQPDNPFKQKQQLPATKVPHAKHILHTNVRVEQSLSSGEPRKRFSVRSKASEGATPAKQNSILCNDCDGNGMVLCSQCKGNGVNSVDHFNGRFKAGATCWLCRGKREMLCGNCNGAGFMGGFMTTPDS